MSLFATVTRGVGLHSSNFSDNVLPRIPDLPPAPPTAAQNHILVCLPFEDQAVFTEWLNGFSGHRFLHYASKTPNDKQENVGRRSVTITGFKSGLASALWVVCNYGLGPISEWLQWRKPVLARLLAKQTEQLTNGAALETPRPATIMRQIDNELAARWLAAPPSAPNLPFPDLRAALGSRLADGAKTPVAALGSAVWEQPATV